MARVGILLFASAIFIGLMGGCKGELRGKSVRSIDGKTYLVVDDDNGGGCGPILVDGRKWPHPFHSPGPIEPGVHKIECGGAIEFELGREPRSTLLIGVRDLINRYSQQVPAAWHSNAPLVRMLGSAAKK